MRTSDEWPCPKCFGYSNPYIVNVSCGLYQGKAMLGCPNSKESLHCFLPGRLLGGSWVASEANNPSIQHPLWGLWPSLSESLFREYLQPQLHYEIPSATRSEVRHQVPWQFWGRNWSSSPMRARCRGVHHCTVALWIRFQRPLQLEPSLYHCIIGHKLWGPHFEIGDPKMIPSISTILLTLYPLFLGLIFHIFPLEPTKTARSHRRSSSNSVECSSAAVRS